MTPNPALDAVKNDYLNSGLDSWLSNFGDVYYHPDAELDSIENYTLVDNGSWKPTAIMHLNNDDYVALTHTEGASWDEASDHLDGFWRKKGKIALEAICLDTDTGDQFVNGVLAVSSYSPLGSLVKSDDPIDNAVPSDDAFQNALPCSMLYTKEAVNWAKLSVQELLTDDEKSLGMDYIGTMFAHTGGTGSALAYTANIEQQDFDWAFTPTQIN